MASPTRQYDVGASPDDQYASDEGSPTTSGRSHQVTDDEDGNKYSVDGTPPPVPPKSIPRDPALIDLDPAFQAAYASSKVSRIDQLEDRASDSKIVKSAEDLDELYDKLNTFYDNNQESLVKAGSALASAIKLDVSAIESAISSLQQTSKIISKGLEILGSVHPFVGPIVGIFKFAVEYDAARRQNSKKILLIKVQMQDMVTVLFDLRTIRDPERRPEFTARMTTLIITIKNDMVECGSDCDAYQKKNILKRTIKAKSYEERLSDYAKKFQEHKNAIQSALTMYTARGVDIGLQKLDGILKAMQDMLRKVETDLERNMRRIVEEAGGPKRCVDNDEALKKLVEKSGEVMRNINDMRMSLRKEIAEDLDDAFKKNSKLFSRKLEAQERELGERIDASGAHVIAELSRGAHDDIKDQELQRIWHVQTWKTNVKARTFVLAINDYYSSKFSEMDEDRLKATNVAVADSGTATPTSPVTPVSAMPQPDDDRWALGYVNVAHMQSIIETVDDDATGYVSIKEANHFARQRPEGQSLLSWLAFWGAGWHIQVDSYRNRIYYILFEMMSLLPRVKPENLQAANSYFAGEGILQVERLLRATHSADSFEYIDGRLMRIAQEIQTAEEEEIKKGLEYLYYDLDDLDIFLQMVVGPQQKIERRIYPLLYLLLKRHFDIMRLACTHLIKEFEFDTMSASLGTVFAAVFQRTRTLEMIFKWNSLDPNERFGTFAFGMFQRMYETQVRDPRNNTIDSFRWKLGYVYHDENLELEPDADRDAQTADDILRYDLAEEPKIFDLSEGYTPSQTLDTVFEGLWMGKLLDPGGNLVGSTLLMKLRRSDDGGLVGEAVTFAVGEADVEVKLESNKIELRMEWPDGLAVWCNGEYDPETETINGSWEPDRQMDDEEEEEETPDDQDPVTIDDNSDQALNQRPSSNPPDSQDGGEASAARARFNFRRTRPEEKSSMNPMDPDVQNRCIELLTKDRTYRYGHTPSTPLSDRETEELMQHIVTLHPSDAQYCMAMAAWNVRKLITFNRYCDVCLRHIHEAHMFCLQCMDDVYYDCIDLCIECMGKTPPPRGGFVHEPRHLMVKTRVLIHDGNMAWVVPHARTVGARAKATFRQPAADRADAAPATKMSGLSGVQPKAATARQVCCYCGELISPPCWACIYCVEDTYICIECEEKCATELKDKDSEHKIEHALVYIFDDNPIPEKVTVALDVSLGGMETRMQERMDQLEKRFAALEALLKQLLPKE